MVNIAATQEVLLGLSFAKKAAPAASATAQASTTQAKPAEAEKPAAAKVIWMKKGADAKKAFAHEETKAEERKAEQGKMWRFFVTPDRDAKITFLDGKLDAEGMLDVMVYYEHRIRINGEWHNYVCTGEVDQSQPCPICEKGDKPAFVGVMTVIDHTVHTIKNGPNAGKTIANTRKLFVAKRTTIKALTKLAVKRGGLAGCSFDVSRSGDKTPAVGETFDFTEKFTKLQAIADKYDLKLEDVQPANYEDEISYRTPEQLIELGVGKAQTGVGHEKGVGNLKNEL